MSLPCLCFFRQPPGEPAWNPTETPTKLEQSGVEGPSKVGGLLACSLWRGRWTSYPRGQPTTVAREGTTKRLDFWAWVKGKPLKTFKPQVLGHFILYQLGLLGTLVLTDSHMFGCCHGIGDSNSLQKVTFLGFMTSSAAFAIQAPLRLDCKGAVFLSLETTKKLIHKWLWSKRPGT